MKTISTGFHFWANKNIWIFFPVVYWYTPLCIWLLFFSIFALSPIRHKCRWHWPRDAWDL